MLFPIAMAMTGIGILSMISVVTFSIVRQRQEKRLLRERVVSTQ